MSTGQISRKTQRMMETAIRRLNALEFVILGMAMALSMVAGWVAAWLLEIVINAPFRIAWTVSSLLFFIVPGAIVLGVLVLGRFVMVVLANRSDK